MTSGQCQRCRVRWELPTPPASCPLCGEPAPVKESVSDWFLGLDLGQAQDPTVLAGCQRVVRVDQPGDVQTTLYRLRLLHAWPLKTSYVDIVGQLAGWFVHEELRHCRVFIDVTRERALLDIARRATLPVVLRPVIITGGHQTTIGDDGIWHVPKKELASTLNMLLLGGRVEWAGDLPFERQLAKELRTFKVKVTTKGNESFEAWRARDHDDLVCGLMMAVWGGETYARHEAPVKKAEAGPVRNPYRWRFARGYESAAARRGLFGLTGRG